MRMPRLATTVLAWGLIGGSAASAQVAEPPRLIPGKEALIVTHSRHFRIPFALDPADRDRAGELTLFVSTDEGTTWKEASRISAGQRSFKFSAPSDGVYWFAVQVAGQGDRGATDELKALAEHQGQSGDR